MLRCGSVGPARPGRPALPSVCMAGLSCPSISGAWRHTSAQLGHRRQWTRCLIQTAARRQSDALQDPGESPAAPPSSLRPPRRPIKPNERVNKAVHRSEGGVGGLRDFIKTHYEEQCVVRRENITVVWCAVTNVVMERGSCARFVHHSHPGIESKVGKGNILGYKRIEETRYRQYLYKYGLNLCDLIHIFNAKCRNVPLWREETNNINLNVVDIILFLAILLLFNFLKRDQAY